MMMRIHSKTFKCCKRDLHMSALLNEFLGGQLFRCTVTTFIQSPFVKIHSRENPYSNRIGPVNLFQKKPCKLKHWLSKACMFLIMSRSYFASPFVPFLIWLLIRFYFRTIVLIVLIPISLEISFWFLLLMSALHHVVMASIFLLSRFSSNGGLHCFHPCSVEVVGDVIDCCFFHSFHNVSTILRCCFPWANGSTSGSYYTSGFPFLGHCKLLCGLCQCVCNGSDRFFSSVSFKAAFFSPKDSSLFLILGSPF